MNTRFAEPVQIYHHIWKLVRHQFFERSRLSNWRSWEHRFDKRIRSTDDALGYAQTMLASLQDEFTRLYDASAQSRVRLLTRQPVGVTSQLFGDVGYIRIEDFMPDDCDWQMQRAISRLVKFSGLVLDLRSNFGGQVELALNCAQLLLPGGPLGSIAERVHPWEETTRSYSIDPLRQTVRTSSSLPWWRTVVVSEKRRLTHSVPGKQVVILVDRNTASAAEVLSKLLQEKGFPVLGERTFGKGNLQKHMSLNGLALLQITSSRYYSPRGHWLGDGQEQRFGVIPNLPGTVTAMQVEPSRFGKMQQDPLLRQALRVLKGRSR